MKFSSEFMAARSAIPFLFLILIISGTALYWTFHRVVPTAQETVRIPQLRDEVTVWWDPFHVPHVTAEQDMDLYTVIGFLHARERLWQMTRQQYKLEGLHSREIGEAMIDADRFYLAMSFGQVSRSAYEKLPDRQQRLLQAYADGVNAYTTLDHRHLPPEFTLGEVEPLTWEPWHSVGVLMLWKWEHHQAFWSKPALTSLHFLNDDSLIRALTGLDVTGHELFGPAPPRFDRSGWEALFADYDRFSRNAAPPQTGFSGTGIALVRDGSEPISMLFHTRESLLTLPDKAFEMVLQSDRGWRSGITLPGLPVLLSGQNEQLAWSVMPLLYDDGDFYSGRLFRDLPDRPIALSLESGILNYLDDGLELESIILTMKDGTERQILQKRVGQMPVVAVSQEHNRYLAFDWIGTRYPADVGALMDMAGARTAEQLRRTVTSRKGPAIQVLFATSDGQTGRLAGGMISTRPYPLLVNEIHFPMDLPHVSSISEVIPDTISRPGAPITVTDRVPAFRTTGNKCLFSPPWDRSDRLLQLAGRTPQDKLPADLQKHWHNDTYSDFAADMTPGITSVLASVHPSDSDSEDLYKVIIPYLKNWNYEFGPNETAAALFQLFFRHAAIKLYEPWLDTKETEYLFRTPNIPSSAVSRLISDPEQWPSDHPRTYEEWIEASMNASAGELLTRFGEEPFDWQWNRVARSGFSSVLFEQTRKNSRLARRAERNLFALPAFNVAGSPHSVTAIHPAQEDVFAIAGATTLKRIMLLHPQPFSQTIVSTGQSGNLFSDHYRDQFELWNKGLLKAPVVHIPAQNQNSNAQLFRP